MVAEAMQERRMSGRDRRGEPHRKGQTVGHVEQVATLAKADPETWIVAKTFCSFPTK